MVFDRFRTKKRGLSAKNVYLAKFGNDIVKMEKYKDELTHEIQNLERIKSKIAEKTLFNILDLQAELDNSLLGDAVPIKRQIRREIPITDIASGLEEIVNSKDMNLPNYLKPIIKGFLANPNNRQKINEQGGEILASLTNENVKAGMKK